MSQCTTVLSNSAIDQILVLLAQTAGEAGGKSKAYDSDARGEYHWLESLCACQLTEGRRLEARRRADTRRARTKGTNHAVRRRES